MTAMPHAMLHFPQLDQLRQVLRLLGSLADIGAKVTTADGLRQTLEQILSLAQSLGLDASFVERVRQTLEDPQIFNVVLAIVQYVAGLLHVSQPAGDGRLRFTASDDTIGTIVEANGFLDWLPFVLQLLELLRLVMQAAQPSPSQS